MINNEFNIIGIAVSEYEKDNWNNSTLKVEVEKMGSKEGNVFVVEVKVYGNNRMVDTDRLIAGEQVAVNGYIDFFNSKKGVPIVRLVAQRVYVLGEQKRRQLGQSAHSYDAPNVGDYDAPEPGDVQKSEFPIDDDELPYL